MKKCFRMLVGVTLVFVSLLECRRAEARSRTEHLNLRLAPLRLRTGLMWLRGTRDAHKLDLMTSISAKIFSGAAAHVTSIGSLTFDRFDPLASGLVGGVWNF